MEDDLKSKSPAEAEKDILKFWQENNIFKKTLEKDAPFGNFVFYDGPPFANGLPHYGHLLASTIKDVIPRYKTMQGYRVPRRWGWDCHGLPVENVVEKELGLKAKKDIEEFGLEKFNNAAKDVVVRDTGDWKKIIPQIGRFVDMEADYKTMDPDYMESVWWIFKTLYGKGLVYEGYKPMYLCPRCETTLANFEVSQGYKDITDISVTVKFKLVDEPNTFMLAWTTTPWTLPGNVALAVNPSIEYATIEKDSERLILAKDLLSTIEGEYKIIETFKGFALAGKSYKPLFDYYSEKKDLENRENGWKIYSADFVTTEEGSGVVHIAPAFGEDDMNVALEYALPFVQHVTGDGRFKSEVKDFAGRYVKPKEDHQETDIEIIKHLAHEGKLFAKKKIIHSYPHCWRCDTPLLNYAASSWFVKVTAIKDKLLKNNGEINWVPAHIKDGRFGKWLAGARDWAISRSRFWGAPLPVWKCDKCDKLEVVGSIDEIKDKVKRSDNKYFVMRHGESEHNKKNIVSSNFLNPHHITEKGKTDIKEIVKELIRQLADKNIDVIFSSDFIRTKETAELVASEIGYDKSKIIFDKRIRELNTGTFDGKSPRDYHDYFSTLEEKFTKTPPKGENLIELKNRVSEFLYDIEEKYQGKNILIISHEYPIWLLSAGAIGADIKKSVKMKEGKEGDYIGTGELMELDFASLPHNENYEIDLHRPYIDKIEFDCACGGKMKRVIHVFDCWFESGSMPYASAHYPFENKKEVESNLPAEFIAEGLDQTRGWFYTLLVLSTALFGKPAYKNVIVNGIILAEDGQKISKRLKNYPDPMDVVHKYGADALRLYLLSSPVVRAESLNFSEHGVDEVYKKVILRLWNVYSFYDMYALGGFAAKSNLAAKPPSSTPSWGGNVLDKWIIARFDELKEEITVNLEKYELDKATRPIAEFVDDLSTWYVRRSRDRFKNEGKDKESAILTTRFVLIEFSKVIAPFMPFMSDRLYKLLGGEKESVHLDEWPYKKSLADNVLGMIGVDRPSKNLEILYDMKEIRKIVSLGLEARAEAGFKVRQPLQKLTIKNEKLKGKDDLLELVKDEVNVKDVVFDAGILNDVKLDLELTPDLIAEGQFRDIVRFIQDLRKKAGLTPDDEISIFIKTDSLGESLVKKFEDELKKIVNARSIEFSALGGPAQGRKEAEDGELLKLDGLEFMINVMTEK